MIEKQDVERLQNILSDLSNKLRSAFRMAKNAEERNTNESCFTCPCWWQGISSKRDPDKPGQCRAHPPIHADLRRFSDDALSESPPWPETEPHDVCRRHPKFLKNYTESFDKETP